jgi:hypothetical protein
MDHVLSTDIGPSSRSPPSSAGSDDDVTTPIRETSIDDSGLCPPPSEAVDADAAYIAHRPCSSTARSTWPWPTE